MSQLTMKSKVNPQRYARRLSDPLFLAIVVIAPAAAVVETVMAALFGSAPVLAPCPSFAPMVQSLTGLASLSAAFLALGRYGVRKDPASYWMAMSFVVLGIGSAFSVLTWPGLLADGHAVLSHLPGTQVWVSMTSTSIFSALLLASICARRPKNLTLFGRRPLLHGAAFFLLISLLEIAIVSFEASLPKLVAQTGASAFSLVAWKTTVMFSFATGAILFAYRYLRSGDVHLGYMALALVMLTFSSFGLVTAARPYDLWWYLHRMFGTAGFLAMLGGFFSEYDGLYRKERERNLELFHRSEALRWETAFLGAVVASSNDGIIILDRERGKLIQNQRIVDLWKIPEEVSEKDEERWVRYLISRVRDPRPFAQQIAYLHAHDDATAALEIELEDGVILDARSSPILGEEGRRYGRIWTFRDITEIRHYWDMLERLSTTDGLTGIANRRRFDDALARELRRAGRDKSPLSVILADIDFFKEFNDHYGHIAGDDCLRRVARCLSETISRPWDLVARYGGEEFACILPSTDLAGAVLVAHRIRNALHDLNIPHGLSVVADRVTLSYGVATVAQHESQPSSDVVARADSLLYRAKQGGRDQIRDDHDGAGGTGQSYHGVFRQADRVIRPRL